MESIVKSCFQTKSESRPQTPSLFNCFKFQVLFNRRSPQSTERPYLVCRGTAKNRARSRTSNEVERCHGVGRSRIQCEGFVNFCKDWSIDQYRCLSKRSSKTSQTMGRATLW